MKGYQAKRPASYTPAMDNVYHYQKLLRHHALQKVMPGNLSCGCLHEIPDLNKMNLAINAMWAKLINVWLVPLTVILEELEASILHLLFESPS